MRIERVVVCTIDDVPLLDINGRAIDREHHLPCPTCGAKWSVQVNDGRFACGSQCHAGWCWPTRLEQRRQNFELASVLSRTLPIPREDQ